MYTRGMVTLIMLPKSVIEQTLDLLEESQWTYDNSDGCGRASIHCRSCGAHSESAPRSDVVRPPAEHQPHCKLAETLRILKASLEDPRQT